MSLVSSIPISLPLFHIDTDIGNKNSLLSVVTTFICVSPFVTPYNKPFLASTVIILSSTLDIELISLPSTTTLNF